MFEARGLRHQRSQRRRAVNRARRTALTMHGLIFFRNSRYFGQLSRSIFDSIHAVIETLQLLPLFIILCAQALVLVLDAQMLCLLRQPVKAVKQTARNSDQRYHGKFEPALMYADATDMSFGTGSTGNDKGIETVVSGHQFC